MQVQVDNRELLLRERLQRAQDKRNYQSVRFQMPPRKEWRDWRYDTLGTRLLAHTAE
jgi:hypothetical protein